MGGVYCADTSIADRAIADCGLWIADSVDRARVCAPRLGAHRANPQSAIRNPQSNWMKFPDRLPIPPEVLKIAQTLEDSGFETWCVGGAIRDNLLGLENHDFDLTTAAPPEEVRKLFKRTVPVGVEHGTIAVLDRHNRSHEVTTFRRDLKTDGRHAVVEFGVSLLDDLARRDFTINAIAYHPGRHEWRDPFKGVEDLERGVIRSVGDANWRFQEDYLRILRALRFSARFEFRIHPRTLEAAKANVQGLAQLSAERVRDEWFKGIATAKRVSKLLTLWIDVGAARIWLPEIRDAGGGMRDAWKAVDKLPRDPVLITAFLASDPASLLPRSRSVLEDLRRVRREAGSEARNAVMSTGSRGSLSTAFHASRIPPPASRISGSQILAAPTSIHSVKSFETRLAVAIPLNHSSRTRSAESCANPCTFAFAASRVRGWIRNSNRALKRSARRIRR